MHPYRYVDAHGTACVKAEALLGKGCFGATYRMRHRHDGMLRAVKQVPKTKACTKEVETIARLPPHCNVVGYFGCRRSRKGHLWIVMELVGEGETLSVTKHYPRRRALLADVAQGLAHIHAHNMVHRDIKCDNIFVRAGGAVVGDFGHATGELDELALYTPRPGVVGRGHWVYRAPEILAGTAYGAAADMWSLGIICLEFAVGMTATAMLLGTPCQDVGAWLQTIEGKETVEDLLADATEPGGLPILSSLLLRRTPEKRPTARAFRAGCQGQEKTGKTRPVSA